MKKLSSYSPTVLRIGMALIFLWFGTSQFIDTTSWLGFVPQWAADLTHLSIPTLVHINGAFEIIFGLALLFGLFTRWVALLLALHMLDITFIVGYTSIGVRDFGLTLATVAIFLNGSDWFTFDEFIKEEIDKEVDREVDREIDKEIKKEMKGKK